MQNISSVNPQILEPEPNGIDNTAGMPPTSDSRYWNIVRHNGVLFPDKYVPVPSNVKILYDGVPVSLDSSKLSPVYHISAEETAFLYAKALELDKRKSEEQSNYSRFTDRETVRNNFWNAWSPMVRNTIIKDFDKVDFTPFVDYIQQQSASKARNKEERGKLKEKIKNTRNPAEKARLEQQFQQLFLKSEQEEKDEKLIKKSIYGYAIMDGVKEPLAGYQIQPPQLFKGHAGNPNAGKIFGRMTPEQVTINVSRKFIPKCFNKGQPCEWGQIVENHTVQWLAQYKNPITNKLSSMTIKRANSKFVKSADRDKFDIARQLQKNIDSVRKQYTKDMNSGDLKTREIATAVYLLDKISIRPGTEKDEEKSADTKGLTTLEKRNLTFYQENLVEFDFLGKSSITFKKTVEVSEIAFVNLRAFCKGKQPEDYVFTHLTDKTLNEYLHTLLRTNGEKSLTSKVFRTWKASSLLQKELDKIPDEIKEPKSAFEEANQVVAIELNHKNMSVSDSAVLKLRKKIEDLEQKDANTSKQIASKNKSLATAKSKLKLLEENISLTTSKQNYIDPRIIISYAKRTEMPLEEVFTTADCTKFSWGMGTYSTWNFNRDIP
jgi:DNA topoisomerase-1